MKKNIIKILIIVAISLSIDYFAIDSRNSMFPMGGDKDSFKYAYGDIYKKLYKKKFRDGKFVYSSQRQYFSDYKDFPIVKPSDTIRIIFLGGSFTFDWAGNITLPVDLVPGKKLEIINAGMPGYDSYRVEIIAKEMLLYDPDLIVLLSGNNEYFPEQGINLKAYYINDFLTRFSLYRKLKKNMTTYKKERAVVDSDQAKQIYLNYHKNLRSIVDSANKKGIPIILCTLPLNLTGSLSDVQEPVNKLFIEAKVLLENGDYGKAIDRFNDYLQENPGDMLGHYFLGRAHEKNKNYNEAKNHYSLAKEVMVVSDTSNTEKNGIVRKIAKEEGTGLLDLEEIFTKIAPNGLTGMEQFRDHCHIWEEYVPLVDRSLIKIILQNNTIYSKLFDSNKTKEKLEEYTTNIETPMFKEIVENDENWERITFHAVINSIQANNKFSEQSLLFLETLYLMDPNSLWNIQYSEKYINRLLNQDPYSRKTILANNEFSQNWYRVLSHVGETYRRLRKYEEALVYFDTSIDFNQDDYASYLGRSLTYHSLNNKQKAKRDMEKALLCKDTNKAEINVYQEILGL
ncbi:MAG: tetratricopeptide repeat protein [Candidatus Omnitrophica bacterium]|nr:tetratricopeptide repeat protein [Candidatus Omnitrophota bacterium]MBU1995935.1 tetratricopeptide repeat protein [Candidatus Omnitrophota bacterium]